MRRLLAAACLLFLLSSRVLAAAEPSPQGAKSPRETADRALDLAARNRIDDARVLLKAAIAADSSDVRAHAAYIRIKTYYLDAYDEMRAEYDALLTREPNNPVYPMALALGVPGAVTGRTRNEWYRRVAELTPDSAWGHYARAQLLLPSDPRATISDPRGVATELRAAIDMAPSMPEPYEALFVIEETVLKDLDAAIGAAERMAAQPGLGGRAWPTLWRLRFDKAGRSDEATKDLRIGLERASATDDVSMLAAVRQTYLQTLKDKAAADRVAARIRRIDRSWYPERGVVTFFGPTNVSGVGRNDPLVGRGASLVLDKVRYVNDVVDPAKRLSDLQDALKMSPTAVVTRFIRESIFTAAESAGNTAVMVADGKVLFRIDPSDAAVPARIALALAAETSRLPEALRFAEAARKLTAEWHPIERPANTDADLFTARFPENRQRDIFNRQRALALDAHGLVLCQLGDCVRAEPLLRESVSLNRSERNLSHLANALRQLARVQEADTVAREAAAEFAASVRRQLIVEPAKDFRLQTLDGATISLQSLKDKVVLLSFWATWCEPCKLEMPRLADFYRRTSTRGLEILAVTTETSNERKTIAAWVQRHDLPFPVLYSNGLDSTYRVNGLPTTIAIDRLGNIRYRHSGFNVDETMRTLEVVVNELLN